MDKFKIMLDLQNSGPKYENDILEHIKKNVIEFNKSNKYNISKKINIFFEIWNNYLKFLNSRMFGEGFYLDRKKIEESLLVYHLNQLYNRLLIEGDHKTLVIKNEIWENQIKYDIKNKDGLEKYLVTDFYLTLDKEKEVEIIGMAICTLLIVAYLLGFDKEKFYEEYMRRDNISWKNSELKIKKFLLKAKFSKN